MAPWAPHSWPARGRGRDKHKNMGSYVRLARATRGAPDQRWSASEAVKSNQSPCTGCPDSEMLAWPPLRPAIACAACDMTCGISPAEARHPAGCTSTRRKESVKHEQGRTAWGSPAERPLRWRAGNGHGALICLQGRAGACEADIQIHTYIQRAGHRESGGEGLQKVSYGSLAKPRVCTLYSRWAGRLSRHE